MRRSYVVPMKWMVIYEYEVPGGDLTISDRMSDFVQRDDIPVPDAFLDL
jgi:hypothetical protein